MLSKMLVYDSKIADGGPNTKAGIKSEMDTSLLAVLVRILSLKTFFIDLIG